MTRKVYDKAFFQNMTAKMLNTWLVIHRKKLIGSAIFTANDSITSKIVSWASSWGKDKEVKKSFIPSHTGSIIEYENNLFVFDMKPPKASMTTLTSYLLYTKDDFRLILRDFELDTKMFSANIAYHNGEFYPYLSAIRSVFTKRNTKWVRHCSELHCRELQKQDLFKELNPECTPLELYEVLTK